MFNIFKIFKKKKSWYKNVGKRQLEALKINNRVS